MVEGKKMRSLVFVFILTLLCCEKGGEVSNKPPKVERASFSPERFTLTTNVEIEYEVSDPEGDPVDITIVWKRNGEPLDMESSKTLNPDYFRKGDLISCEIIPRDSLGTGKTFTVGPVKVLNTPPIILSASIIPQDSIYNGVDLNVEIDVEDVDGDSITFKYRWFKNDEEVHTGATLPGRMIKRDNEIYAEITPSDDEMSGKPVITNRVQAYNSLPTFVSTPPGGVKGWEYTYQLKAEDPDGDTLTYSLASGPQGATVNDETGLLKWKVSEDVDSVNIFKVEASDGFGGKAEQEFQVRASIRR